MDSTVSFGSLTVEIHPKGSVMADVAAKIVVRVLNQAIRENGSAHLLLATGTSQLPFLESLTREDFSMWSRVSIFHLDEYIGISRIHPASFRRYLQDRVVEKVLPWKMHFLQGDAPDITAEIKRYEDLLVQNPIDIACIGIGENGHIAFNEPGDTDFNDPEKVRVVGLGLVSRQQQVSEGWFNRLSEVPVQALTLTVPAIMKSRRISCFVPESRKADAVKRSLLGPISEDCPASILRTHPSAILYLDSDSASGIQDSHLPNPVRP